MKRIHPVLKLILVILIFFTGCLATLVVTREWVYCARVNEIKIVKVDGSDYLKISLLSHPPWAKKHTNTYVVNTNDMTIKIVSSYIVFIPFSIHETAKTDITNFNVLIPGNAIPEGTYELQHYDQSKRWETMGVLERDPSGKFNYAPHL